MVEGVSDHDGADQEDLYPLPRRDGPDPLNWSIRRTTFPGILILEEGQCHEEVTVYGRTDRLCTAPGRKRHTGGRGDPQNGHH